MKQDHFFSTYNQISKKFVVMAITIQELINNSKHQDKKCLVLLPKKISEGPKRQKRKKKSKLDMIIERLDNINQRLVNVEQRLNNLVKLNKLREK